MLRETDVEGPGGGLLLEDEARALLRAAAAAPSSHNSQPWDLRWTDGAVEVHGAPERAPTVSDPDHRELRIACGAAIANVRAVVRAHGRRAHTQLLPLPGDPWFLGRVRPAAAAVPTRSETELAAAVHRRRTDRHPFTGVPVPVRLRGLLSQVAQRERWWLVFADAGERRRLRALTADAARRQAADPAFRAEWARWIGHPDRLDDGPPAELARRSPPSDRTWRVRDFGLPALGEPEEGGDGRSPSVEEEPAIAVVSTFTDSPVSQLQAGQATQFVLLAATVAGVSASFVAAPLEVPEVRREVRGLLGGALWPQMVLRLGYGRRPVPAPPRRGSGPTSR